jgi:hypothetical protein
MDFSSGGRGVKISAMSSARDHADPAPAGHDRPVHDMGGLAAGPVDRVEHDPSHFEKCVDALLNLLVHPSRRVIRVDELRRAIEALGPERYDSLTYYQKWMDAMTRLLVEKGVLGAEEIARRQAAIEAELAAGK